MLSDLLTYANKPQAQGSFNIKKYGINIILFCVVISCYVFL